MSLNCSHQRVCCSSPRLYVDMELRWSDIEMETLKNPVKKMSRHFVHHQSQIDCSGLKPGPPRWLTAWAMARPESMLKHFCVNFSFTHARPINTTDAIIEEYKICISSLCSDLCYFVLASLWYSPFHFSESLSLLREGTKFDAKLGRGMRYTS
jgi:hypothetical protein